MDVPNLNAFVAVAETGSFSVASDQLFLTQPAISKRVSALETELDVQLFDRIGRKVTLTEAGTELLSRARTILQQVEDSKRAIQNLSGHVAGKLSIGTSHHIGLHRLPPVLRAFTHTHPEVELDLHFMDSEEACHAIEHGDLELGIVTLPLEPAKVLHTYEVWPDPLDIVVNQSHPLTLLKKITPKELANYSAILPTRGTYTRQIFEHTMRKHKLELKVGLSTNYLETIKMMVSVGLGWSVLPRSMLSKELKTLCIDGITLERKLGIVWHSGHTLSNAAKAMSDMLMPGEKIC
ncbi:MAG: LysR family transcriptional regulator [Gammaproteobacteria bacterium]|nr:LysR family transcriptional regulator [Gammaproteobacteria bacterium]MCW8988598.1 LysR family transcriptional regulator [Gammaproteobacteria bacterium]MCW9030266.1 LysR family transcriptional regulator [Gammaproteobacteria bacterium]